MNTTVQPSFYASLRIEGEVLVAIFEEDPQIEPKQWILEVQSSLEEWLQEHREGLGAFPKLARLIQKDQMYEFPISEDGKLEGPGFPPLRTGESSGPHEVLLH